MGSSCITVECHVVNCKRVLICTEVELNGVQLILSVKHGLCLI